jgi:hypothetical protein
MSCGEYSGDSSSALDDMRGIAGSLAQNYYWANDVYHDPYWWARVTPFDEPAYYDSAWEMCFEPDCGSW